MKRPFLACCLVLLGGPAASQEASEVREAIARATGFLRAELAAEGGYASRWTMDPFTGHSEHRSSPTVISIQPHGTTTIGLALLRAYHATGDRDCLSASREAAGALIRCQLSSGGWHGDFDFDPDAARRYHLLEDVESGDREPGKRRHRSTLDDNKTQSALLLLLELSSLPEFAEDDRLQRATRKGLEALLAAQYPDGSWPQQFPATESADRPILEASLPEAWPREWPDASYWQYSTLNDGNLTHVLTLLLRAHELTGEDRYLAAAKKLGEFFLRAQLPEPQPAWAQQYNERMHPAWARRFEPPAVSSVESFGVMEALLHLWTSTGDPRYRDAIVPALDWLESSRREDGSWARFYELGTNRPLFCEAGSYRLTYDDDNLPTHYGFLVTGFKGKIQRAREALAKPLEGLRSSASRRRFPALPEPGARANRERVRETLASQRPDGSWREGNEIDARDVVRHLSTLAEFSAATREGP